MIRGERVLITGGAGAIGSNLADLLVQQGAGEIVILDNFVRGRRDNLAWAEANGPVTVVEGDICDRDLVRELVRGSSTSSSTRRRCASRSAPRSRGSRSRCSSTARSTSSRPPPTRACASSSPRPRPRSTASRSSSRPTEDHHPYANDTLYGAAKVFNEGLLRSFHAMSGPGLRRAALLQRLRPADGHPRRLHRGARALDGADRRGQAAADPRRRQPRRWTSSPRATSPAPTCSPPRATPPTPSSTSRAAPRRASTSLATMLLRVMGSDLDVEYGPERNGQQGARAGWPTPRRRASELGFEAEVGPRGGPHASSSPGGPSTATAAASSRSRTRSRGRVMQVPFARPTLLRRGGRGARRGRSSRAGSPRARASQAFEARVRRARRRRARRSPRRTARPRCSWRSTPRASAPATRSSSRRCRSSRPPTRSGSAAPRRSSPTSTRAPTTSTRSPPSRRSRRAPRRSCPCTRSACRPTWTRSSRSPTRTGSRSSRTPPAPIGASYKGRPIGSLGLARVLLAAPAQGHHHRRGRHDHDATTRALADRMRKLRQHAMDLSDLARHDAEDIVFESYPERGWNCRMTDMQAAVGLCQLDALDEILAERTRQAERYNAALASCPHLETPFEPEYTVRTWQSYAVRVAPGVAVRTHRADAAAAPRRRRDAPRHHGDPPRGRLHGRRPAAAAHRRGRARRAAAAAVPRPRRRRPGLRHRPARRPRRWRKPPEPMRARQHGSRPASPPATEIAVREVAARVALHRRQLPGARHRRRGAAAGRAAAAAARDRARDPARLARLGGLPPAAASAAARAVHGQQVPHDVRQRRPRHAPRVRAAR